MLTVFLAAACGSASGVFIGFMLLDWWHNN
jgi:hypothetical protein